MVKWIGLFLAMFLVPAAVQAQTLIKADDPESIAEIFRSLDYRAQLETDSDGDPVIRSTFGGIPTSVYFYSCTEGADCEVIQFVAGFDKSDGVSSSLLNDWNKNRLFGASYRDDEDDPWLKVTVNMEEGITPGNLISSIEWWELAIDQFKDHIDF